MSVCKNILPYFLPRCNHYIVAMDTQFSRISWHFPGRTFWQAIRVCPHSKFLLGRRPAKMLVGELPKPAVLRDKLSQSPGALHRSLRPVTIVPGPYFHARLLCRADDQCSLLLPRPPAFAAGPPGILHKALFSVLPAHGGIFLVLQS